MKHDGSTRGHSTERGKIAGGFYSAWNLHGLNNDSLASSGQHETISARSRKRLTAFKGIFRLIERHFSVSGIIAKGV